MNRCLLLSVLVAGCGGEPDVPVWSWDSSIDWRDHAGWYETSAGDSLLMVEGARGGLRVYDLARGDVSRIVPLSTDSVLWIRPGGATAWHARWEGRTLAWSDSGGGRADPVRGPTRQETIRVMNGEIEIAATVFLPQGDGPFPASVYIHGSGTSDRDSEWRVRVADGHARAGIVMVLPDKRGSGRTTGEWESASFGELATDTEAVVDWIAAHPAVDAGRVGVFGLSQGGWIAPIVAARDSALSFVVNVSGAGVPIENQLLHEVEQDLRNGRMPGFMAHRLAPLFARRAQGRQPEFWAANAGFDPMTYWRVVFQPILVIYGSADERDNVPVGASVARWAAEIPHAEVRVFESAGHGIEVPPRESSRMLPDALDHITRWILRLPSERR